MSENLNLSLQLCLRRKCRRPDLSYSVPREMARPAPRDPGRAAALGAVTPAMAGISDWY